ncbi:phosphoribosylanthranilate isomerase [Bacteroides ihuae]|uniref:phosphoribosylanthranilate isomerase n=1 Tax=Bacteroides ihuae TaxID=1852362 RepID=UPI0008D9FE6C|nr:phosphoribosylanthranilate isomerase [Bacteroides ihuae]
MINGKLIKVCGMREAQNIREVEQLGVDMIGFIFYHKSPRCVSEMPQYMPTKAKRIGVFVNETKEMIQTMADRFDLEYIQLHGKESPSYCRSLQLKGLHLIKAFSISNEKDVLAAQAYEGYCDYYLFDTKSQQHGGSGNQFDWNLLKSYTGETPFLLSGGINLYSIKALKEFTAPKLIGFDLNSRFELAPGKKDIKRLESFLQQI